MTKSFRTPSGLFLALSLGLISLPLLAQSPVTQYEHDANGNRTKITAPLGRITVMSYDGLNRLTQVTDPAGGIARYGYDGQNRLTQVTDPRSLITRYTLDGLGNQTQLQSPDTGTRQATFDAAGNPLTQTDAKGQTTTTQYDALNRPTQIVYADGRKEIRSYDQGPNGIGRLTRIEERDGGNVLLIAQDFAYDGQGRILTHTRTLGSVSLSVGYRYSNGRLIGIDYPSGRKVDYSLDGNGRLQGITLTDNGQQKVLVSAITYRPFGGWQSYTNGAGKVVVRSFDQDGRLTGYRLSTEDWLLGYDTASRITYQTDAGNAANTATYGYDLLDRLTQAVLPSVTQGYGYDANSNRTSQTVGAGSRSYAIDAASNRVNGISGQSPRTYSYDAVGNRTNDGQMQSSHDARNRLTGLTTAAGSSTYLIDAQGLRLRKDTPEGSTLYVYDSAGHLLNESDPQGKPRRDYVWLGDTPLAVID